MRHKSRVDLTGPPATFITVIERTHKTEGQFVPKAKKVPFSPGAVVEREWTIKTVL